MKSRSTLPASIVLALVTSSPALLFGGELCQGYGPQTPRDIDIRTGTNQRVFSLAPPSQELNLCNIHFHVQAEHRARDFSLQAEGQSGFQCNATPTLSDTELSPLPQDACSGVSPGDTIEVHWVFSSCDVAPGKGLGSCLSEACSNPDLRVEAQVFLVVNDPDATDFADLSYAGNKVDGRHQPRALPIDTGAPVEFAGSTTGPAYSEHKCSPLQVTWSVRPYCKTLDLSSLGAWCSDNVFDEDHAHGVRPLVEAPELLAPIS